MIKKIYSLGNEARQTISAVSKQISDILGKTLGPAGRNYFLPQGITNDGRTIVSEIRFDEECQDQIALAFHEIARQQDKDAGDGTTTAMVLGAELYLSMVNKIPDIDLPVGNEITVMGLLQDIDKEKDKALELLKAKIIKTDNLEDLRKVSFTSLENREAADMVAETMWRGGKDCYPVLDYGFNGKIETEVVKGVSFPLNIATTAMFNEIGRTEFHDVNVIVANHCFEQYTELTPFMFSMMNSKVKVNALVIVAKQFSVPFVQSVMEVSKRTNFPIILLSANFHNDTFEDIASYVGAKMIDTHPKTGVKITDLKFDDAGFCKTFIAREKETIFMEGKGLELIGVDKNKVLTRVGKRVEEIKKLMETEKSGDERKQMETRIASLTGGITKIYVDAKTAAERYYLKLKVEDAMNSCREAMNEGMVKGGGLVLKEVAEEMGSDSLLYRALIAPYGRIIQNNGGKEFDLGDVYDSYSVIKGEIENAVSVVKVLLTIEGIISDVEKSFTDELVKKINNAD